MKIISFFTVVLLACCLPGCKPKTTAPQPKGLVDINLAQPVQNADWSKILELKGFVPLSTPEPFKSISNILFVDDKIITLDTDTKFEAIRIFDGKTGAYLYDIGKRMETDDPAEGYFGVIDIAYNPDHKLLRLLSNGQLRFSDYDLSGKYQGSIKYDFYGSDLAYLGNDQWVVYNELYANETIGHHYLVFYNSKGEIINKALPYKKSLNGNAFDFAGYLMRSGNDVWFNAPFNDTVFSVTGTQATPRYRMLDSITLQTGKSRDKIYGDGVSDEIFLEEGFFSNGRYFVFPFVRNSKVPLGIYDTQKNLFMDSGNLDKSVLFNKLCMSFTIFPKDASTFAMVEKSGYLQKIMKEGDRGAWEKVAPGLYDSVMNTPADSGKPYLLFFSFKQP